MRTLIWKEFRLCWPILLTGGVLLLAPYALPLSYALHHKFKVAPSDLFVGAAVASLALWMLTAALLGGNAIACERADRSAEFLACQPISRSRILASKLVWPIIAAAAVWCINLLVLYLCAEFSEQGDADTLSIVGACFVVSLLSFSVAWLISALQSSPTYAVGGGMATPLVIWLCFLFVDWLTKEQIFGRDFAAVYLAYSVTCLVVAVTSLACGCWYYLRRVEP